MAYPVGRGSSEGLVMTNVPDEERTGPLRVTVVSDTI